MSDLKAKIKDPELPPFERLCAVMKQLRAPDGCAWDRAQTHKSLLPYLIEETYEVVEAIEAGDFPALREELGDLLCQVVFHAQLASERGDFDIDDSTAAIVEKLIERHPHVFDEKAALSPDQVNDQWEKIKAVTSNRESILSGLSKSMPALTMAYRIGEKAAGVGFDWTKSEDALDKIQEELDEVRQELHGSGADRQERLTEEIGDLLFAVASAARKLAIEPETALRAALRKFRQRFAKMEQTVKRDGGTFDNYTLDQLENLWQQIKHETDRG